MSRPVHATALAVALAVLVGCTSDTVEPDPSPTATTGPRTDAAPSTPADEPAVTHDAEYLGVPIRLEVDPVQVDGDVALLSVDYSLGEGAASDATVPLGLILQPPTGPAGVGGVRLVDEDAALVLLPGLDATGQPVTTRDALATTADGPVHSDALFAAPTAGTVDVLFPYLGLVRDVPVEPTGDAGLGVSPADLGREGEITYPTALIDAFTVALDDSSSARVEGENVTVSLASDVLFAPDASDLTAAAQGVVDAAAAALNSSGSAGQVSVVGHTDDVDTDAYNLDLSNKRADAVATRLRASLDPAFTVTSEGRGESEPAVAGTSADARAANRRVEIRYTAEEAGAPVTVTQQGAVPEADVPVASGDAAVSVDLRGEEYAVNAESVLRTGPYLFGSLRVERLAPGDGGLLEMFGTATAGLAAGRGLKATTLVAGAHNVTLLADGSRFYPSDYVRPGAASEDRRATLADQFLAAQLAQGEAVTVTVIWPDPGGETVTIDVPERFRLTDVPVEG